MNWSFAPRPVRRAGDGQFIDLNEPDAMSITSAAFGKLIADETEKWGKVIRATNIKVE
jgi:hypothetical protein